MSQNRGHQPQRWQNQSAQKHNIWEYYSNVIVPRIIHAALSRDDVTLFDLYHALARARAKCEWIKTHPVTTDEEIELLARQETDWFGEKEFGQYVMTSSQDVAVTCPSWGQDVHALVMARIPKSNINHAYGYKIALSKIDWLTNVSHQPRVVLNQLEQFFQTMIRTDNIGEFLSLAATIVYELSNYTTVVRGNAAICAWLMEGIFQEKFGKYFTNKIEMRPFLQDWFAFFEAQNEFKNFYVMSVVANILKSSALVSAEDKEFLAKLQDHLTFNPYHLDHLNERSEVWKRLQEMIAALLNDESVSNDEWQQLLVLKEMKLIFLKPSRIIQRICNMVNFDEKYNEIELQVLLGQFSDIEVDYLKSVLDYNVDLDERHYETVGRPISRVASQFWFDLEMIRASHIRALSRDQFLIKDLLQMLGHKAKSENRMFDANRFYEQPHRDAYCASLLDHDHVKAISNRVVVMLGKTRAQYYSSANFTNRLYAAIASGGIKVQEIDTLTDEQLVLLVSPCAILLYNAGLFIHAKDLIANTIEEMKLKILLLVAEHYCNEKIEDASILREHADVLLTATDLYQVGGIKMSTLMGQTAVETEARVKQARTDRAEQVNKPQHMVLSGRMARGEINTINDILDLDLNSVLYLIHANKLSQERILKLHLKLRSPIKMTEDMKIIAVAVEAKIQSGYLDGISLYGMHLTKANLQGLRMRNAELSYVEFDGCDLTGADFTGAKIGHTNFSNSNFTKARFDQASLTQVKMHTVKCCDTSLYGAHLKSVDLTNATLDSCVLSRVVAENCNFTSAKLVNCNVAQSEITECVFNQTSLPITRLDSVSVKRCWFTHVDLTMSEFENVDLERSTFKYVRFNRDKFMSDADKHSVYFACMNNNELVFENAFNAIRNVCLHTPHEAMTALLNLYSLDNLGIDKMELLLRVLRVITENCSQLHQGEVLALFAAVRNHPIFATHQKRHSYYLNSIICQLSSRRDNFIATEFQDVVDEEINLFKSKLAGPGLFNCFGGSQE